MERRNRFLVQARATVIHRHEIGDLYSLPLPNDPEQVWRAVHASDPSTGRKYFLRVLPQIGGADDAVAWTFGFETAKQYRPEEHT